MKKRNNRGISTVEYLFLMAAVIGVMLVFTQPSGIFSTALNQTILDSTERMTTVTDRIFF
ncbi:hypothetical protein MNBD_BACTEROID05-1214 [hydrothermal vent metagenome]|uniref:Uncharacterized protein n=1 Tax=hydrothermal vent metagenome TaxID=652676 RepID=A0A3B0UEJ3_9ZZZZ